ncbi:thioredoxin-like protein [Vararia minispora EC-137]|uniref:Thioredoxin-like protein n=1 Tax=Vararia minispora EC-137 TaxID=1314806 RepID=A0ACB8QLX1_9AGAM|nr:thioredoxin-like protein [Vararia minispora EC-137]
MLRSALQPTVSATRAAFRKPTSATLLRRLLSNDARARIQRAIEAKPVVLFMKGTPSIPQCGFSRAAIQVLDLHGVPPEKMKTYNVLEDSELRSGIKEFSDWPTIPQLYVGGEFVGGCDIMLSMHQSGELEKLLQDNKVIVQVEGEAAEKAVS